MKQIDTRMFVVLVRYTQPEEVVMRHLSEHRKFIEQGYARGVFIVSGRGADGDPGVYVASGVSREELREFIKGDALYRESVAEYEIVGFHASRACDELGQLFPSAQ
jgi:uncharacterized protein YciI